MLDFFVIFSRGGIVLWSFQLCNYNYRGVINSFISNILFEEKTVPVYRFEKNSVEYRINNDQRLILAAGYNIILNLPYVKELLFRVEQRFVDTYSTMEAGGDYSSFDSIFDLELRTLEQAHRGVKKPVEPPPAEEPVKVAEQREQGSLAHQNENDQLSEPTVPAEDVKKFPKSTKKAKNNKKKKQARTWGDKVSKEDAVFLDYSDKSEKADMAIQKGFVFVEGSKEVKPLFSGSTATAPQSNNDSNSTFFGYFKNLIGAKTITKEMLDPILNSVQDHLTAKNVTLKVAEKICEAVSSKLIGTSLGTFGGTKSTVQSCLSETLTNILTPKKSINILQNIQSKTTDRPYVVVFCGVNGVGKSTNLAKIAYYLINNGQRVLIAACDTFRSGAVEQLKIHVSRFNSMFASDVPSCDLYEKGYGRHSASVAADAIRMGVAEKYTVVLIDTAGRMQDNEPLMRSLAKLIKVNNPDLVLFVGEALVGNDGTDQLKKFDRHLLEFSDDPNPHRVDGIILTKCDTIDDKIGAAISMVYSTGHPIVFIGVGQTYSDLRILDVKSAVSMLLK